MLSSCKELLVEAQHKSIAGIEFILKYENDVSDDEYSAFVQQNPLITALTLHSATDSKYVVVNSSLSEYYDGAPLTGIRFTTQEIDSHNHCGLITQKHLTPPSVNTFFEAKSFNGCLNRKISVDADGNIKNCPSMNASYGNVHNTSLVTAVNSSHFKEKWETSKDHIAICCDCEFRYACSDCRGYLENPSDALSKPLKCGYDPYTGVWNEWTNDPNKLTVAKLYGIELRTNR
jgi:SPASM domain peptide maturase of grasp-with-spasm system